MAKRPPARERILDAASRLFYGEGVRAVGIERILAESDVAKATLYSHFTSKDELVAAWLERRDREWMAWFRTAVANRGGGLEAVFGALRDWFEAPGFRGCAFINTQGELRGTNPRATALVRAHKAQLLEELTAVARREGALAEAGAQFARELLLLVEGTIVTAMISDDPTVADSALSLARRACSRLDG